MEAPGKAQAFPKIFADVPPWGTSAILRGVPAINLGPPMHILGNFFPQFSIFQKKNFSQKKKLCEAMYSGGENRIKYLSNQKGL